jgi:hypothetical protein
MSRGRTMSMVFHVFKEVQVAPDIKVAPGEYFGHFYLPPLPDETSLPLYSMEVGEPHQMRASDMSSIYPTEWDVTQLVRNGDIRAAPLFD